MSESQHTSITSIAESEPARPPKTLNNKVSSLDLRESVVSTGSSAAVLTKDEAMLKTMRSLEGRKLLHKISHDVLGNISRPAPSPPKDLRPVSLDSAKALQQDKENVKAETRSMSVIIEGTTNLKIDVAAGPREWSFRYLTQLMRSHSHRSCHQCLP